MQLPKKIIPDNIVDGIVQVSYQSQVPYDILVGTFFNALDKNYFYDKKGPEQMTPQIISDPRKGVIVRVPAQNVFYNDKIRVVLQANSFLFSSLNQYVGWEILSGEIQQFLEFVWSLAKIDFVKRIGVRFINQYNETDLRKVVNFDFTFQFPQVISDSFVFQSEFSIENFKVILNLKSNVIIQVPFLLKSSEKISAFDIDIIDDNNELTDLREIFERINSCHLKEKEIFYTLLKKEFLSSLNVEY